jgi:peptidoglycan/LPS O-acetylase OafA/YrhL
VFLGRISYGLYVWHWAGNRFGPELASPWLSANMTNELAAWFAAVVPALSLTVVLAVVSYFVLERPFLRIRSRFTIVPNRPV